MDDPIIPRWVIENEKNEIELEIWIDSKLKGKSNNQKISIIKKAQKSLIIEQQYQDEINELLGIDLF